jgi:hypothetical protein
MKSKFLLLTLCLSSLLFTGCIVAAVGAGIGAAKYGSAKQRDAYATYRNAAERNNTDREKASLAPVKILTYDEWAKGKESTPATK